MRNCIESFYYKVKIWAAATLPVCVSLPERERPNNPTRSHNRTQITQHARSTEKMADKTSLTDETDRESSLLWASAHTIVFVFGCVW